MLKALLRQNLEAKRRVRGEAHTDTSCAAINLAAVWAEGGWHACLDKAAALASRTLACAARSIPNPRGRPAPRASP